MAFGKIHALSMVGLVFLGLVILLISLSAANRVTTGLEVSLTGNRLYFGRKILPDHMFYPILMANDRLIFMSAQPEEKLMLRLAYANDRFDSAQQLLDRNRPHLAVTTFTKSQKYIMLSGLEVLNDESINEQSRQKVIEAVDYSVYRLQTILDQIPDPEREVIANLIEETKVLQQQLADKYSADDIK